MRAIQLEHHGDPNVLELAYVADPLPSVHDVVVNVEAVGVNFTDTNQRRGLLHYRSDHAIILGSEGAGTVTAVGEQVRDVRIGDRVAFWQPGCGAYAEQVAVAASRTVPIPDEIDGVVAAALMVQGLTAHYLANSVFPVTPGDVAVVHTGAGGVGNLLTQLIKQRGGIIVATSSSPAKWPMMLSNGASRACDYEGFVDEVRDLTSGAGADVVYDSVGAATFARGLDALRTRGLMVLYGSSSGVVPPFDLMNLYSAGSLYVTHPTLGDYIASRSELLERWSDLVQRVVAGQLEVRIGATYPFENARQAHWDLESRSTTGKLLLLP
jgi:NADPH:quinone reductase